MITCALIVDTVCQTYGLTRDDLFARRRDRSAPVARHMAFLLARELTQCSYPEIGRHMGGYDHSTVLRDCRMFMAALGDDPDLDHNYRAVRDALKVLGATRARSIRLQGQWRDADAIEIATRIVEPSAPHTLVSYEDITALASGVLHYADTASRLTEMVAAEASARANVPAPVAQQTSRLTELARSAAAAWRTVQIHRATSNEAMSRKLLDDVMLEISIMFPKDI